MTLSLCANTVLSCVWIYICLSGEKRQDKTKQRNKKEKTAKKLNRKDTKKWPHTETEKEEEREGKCWINWWYYHCFVVFLLQQIL